MDYHLDCLYAALELSRSFQPVYKNLPAVLKGTHEDIDLLVAWQSGKVTHIAMVAAKDVNGMITPVDSASREASSVMLAWHQWVLERSNARVPASPGRSWVPPRDRRARFYDTGTSRGAASFAVPCLNSSAA